jgi:aldose 1-epimerase
LVIVKLLNLNPMIRQTFSTFMALILFFGCETKEKPKETVSESSFTISEQAFGVTQGGDSVTLFTFANGNGLEVKIMNYGGIVTHLSVPDEAGKVEDIVLGFDQLADYEKGSPYFGQL